MKKDWCLRCKKNTECMLISKGPDPVIQQSVIQCLECGLEMGTLNVPIGYTVMFSGEWGVMIK